MNASDVIDDRVVLESGNTQYLACIIPDFDPGSPLKEWDQSVSFYVPMWDYENRNQKHAASLLDNEEGDIPVDIRKICDQSQSLRDKTTEASWYDDTYAHDWLTLLRRCDPSGIYFIVQWNDSGYGDTLKFLPDDDDSTRDYVIAYRTSEEIRADHMVKRITAKVRAQAEANIRAAIETQNAYFAGEVYGWYLIRQELDDDGETIESEDVASCYGYYGSDEWEYMYSEAKGEAEACERNRAEQSAHAFHSLDLFDAASYHDLSMNDVVGAFQARLSTAFDNLGRVTRQLEEEGYRPHALFG